MRFTFPISMLIIGISSHSAWAEVDPLSKPANQVAREHLSQGNKLYRLRNFEQAIEAYKAGALIEDAPVFAYNLGQCYRQLGTYDAAIWHYERFLSRANPQGVFRATVSDFISQMKAEQERKAMRQAPIEPGPNNEAGNSDFASTQIQSGIPQSNVIRSSHWYEDGVGWLLAGTGAVTVSAGGYFFMRSGELDDQANRELRDATRVQLRDDASDQRIVGALALGIGGALITAGIWKLAAVPTSKTVSQALRVSPTANGFAISGTF